MIEDLEVVSALRPLKKCRPTDRRSANGGNRGQGMNWIHQRTRRRVYWRDGLVCVWCQRGDRGLSLDHIVSRSRGGSHRPANLLTACLTCNEARGEKSCIEFAFELATIPEYAAVILERVIEAMGRPLP